jgi:ribosome-associated protein
VFNTEHLSALFERVIIASGTSNRQTKSLASSVREAVKSAGHPVPRTEGEANGEWIIVDCGAAVVHVMQPNIREYYHLEEIWGDKPVNMKLASQKVTLVKAEASPTASTSAAAKAGAKKATAKKAVTPSGGARKGVAAPSATKPASVARKVAARKAAAPPARPLATTSRTSAGTHTATKSAAKKLVASKTLVVGKLPAKKAPPVAGRGVTRVVGVKSPAGRSAPTPAKRAAATPAPRAPATKKATTTAARKSPRRP